MVLNVGDHIAAVERSVSPLEREGKPAYSVTLSRSYATTIDDLWDAVTNGSRISRWFLPITGELKLGGRYQLEGNAGGRITACERPSHFALTWEFAEAVSWVEVQVSENGASCAKLVLLHIQYGSNLWDEYGPGAVGVGWEVGLMSLAMHITQPSAQMLDASFATTQGGKTFVTSSSERWGQAAISAGTASDTAHAAVARTIAFYTGETA